MSKQLSPKSYDSKIRSLFDSRVAAAYKIASGCARYLGTITDFIRGTNPEEYDKINSSIESIYTAKWQDLDIENASPSEILSHWAESFDKLGALDNNVSVAVSVLTTAEYLRKAVQQTSTTTINIYQERSHILALYDGFRAVSYGEISSLIERVDIDRAIVQKFALDYEKFNQLTSYIIRSAVRESTEPDTRWKLQSRIEKLKDMSFSSTRRRDILVSASKCGLLPITRALSTAQMAAFLGVDAAGDFAAALENHTRNTAFGVIIIYTGLHNATQLEFNLSGLIDAEYVIKHNLKTVPGTGLTKKVIERLSTINRLPKDTPGTLPTITVYGENRPQYWVLQQITSGDNPLYQMLGFGYTAENPEVVHAPMISGLLTGYTSRPEDYNELHADVILSNIYDSEIKTILSAYTVTKLQSPSSDLIRSKILDEMTDKFLADHKKSPMTIKNIRARAVDSDFVAGLLISVLMPNPTKNYTERVITAMAKLDSVTSLFINELEKRWMSAVIPERLFKEYSGAELTEQIRGIFTNTAGAAIDEMERVGAWASLEPTLKEFYFEYKSDRS